MTRCSMIKRAADLIICSIKPTLDLPYGVSRKKYTEVRYSIAYLVNKLRKDLDKKITNVVN